MRRFQEFKYLLLPALVVGLVAVAVPSHSHAARVTRTKLGAVNTFITSKPVFARVRLNDPARMSGTIREARIKGPTDDIDIVGGGRDVAVVLVKDPVPERLYNGVNYFLAGRFSRCSDLPCRSPYHFTTFQVPGAYPWAKPPRVRIPRGNYRLYVVPDGKRVTVKIRLDGPRGHVRLRSSGGASVDTTPSEESLFSNEDGTTYAAGATYDAGLSGIFVGNLYGAADSSTDFDFGTCNYSGNVVPPPDVAYGPGCEKLADGAGVYGYMNGTPAFSLVFTAPYSPAGQPMPNEKQGFGGWLSTDVPMIDTSVQAFFLSLD